VLEAKREVLTTAPHLRAAPHAPLACKRPPRRAPTPHSPFPISPQVLVRGLSSAPLPSLLNLQIELRKCCNHPFLIRGVEQSVIATDCMLIATDCY
jgi:hypothetical protein